MSFLPVSRPKNFRMRKSAVASASTARPQSRPSADELLAEAGRLEAVIVAAGERLALVADELRRHRRSPVALDPRWGLGTWQTAYEIALGALRRPMTQQEFELCCLLLDGFREDSAA
jgi:hypothetical protein